MFISIIPETELNVNLLLSSFIPFSKEDSADFSGNSGTTFFPLLHLFLLLLLFFLVRP